jgi:aspartokinase
MGLIVQKFGSTSVADAQKIKRDAQRHYTTGAKYEI